MRAIVLVGGEGTRLRPLTWRTPKALVPVVNRPLIEHLLLHLKQHGITRVTLAMTGRHGAMEETLGNGARLGLDLEYAYEGDPLGSGGAIASIAEQWTERFVVCNGDVLTDLDLAALLEAHSVRGAELSIAVQEVDDPSPFGVVDLHEDGRIRRFVEKPPRGEAPSRLVNAGTWVFEPHIVQELDAHAFNRVEDGLFPRLAAEGRGIFGLHLPAYWIDVGNAAALLRANLDAARRQHPDGVVIAEDAEIAPDARLDGPLVVGSHDVVGSGAHLAGSVLWNRVRVDAAATVRDSILAADVTVGAGAAVEQCVIGHGVGIEPGTRLVGVSIAPEGAGVR